MRTNHGAVLGIVLLVIGAGCVRPGAPPRVPRAHDVISVEELDRVRENNLLDAVARLRPHFLRSRAITAYGRPATAPLMLYVDGEKMDGVDFLRRLSPGEVLEVRFYEPQVANTRFARYNNAGGAIAVILKTLTASSPDST